MKRLLLSLALMAVASMTFGDQLMMNSLVKDGSFQGFEKGKFRFLTAKGKFVNEQASRVTKLVLSSPKKATYITASSKKEETAMLKGFDKEKFTFAQKDGKEVTVPLSKMTKIEIALESETDGGKSNGGDKYPIPAVDLASFTGDFTPEQQSVLGKFKVAKQTFDDFVKETADMVSDMNKSTGAAREDLINQLRKRKIEEQPLRKNLVAAYKALVEAFPEKPDEPPKVDHPVNGGRAQIEQPDQPAAPVQLGETNQQQEASAGKAQTNQEKTEEK